METTTRTEPPENGSPPGPRPAVRLGQVVVDTDQPGRLSRFYAELLGWSVTEEDEEWVTIRGEEGIEIAFQLALDHRRPTWPDSAVPQQFHLDLTVPDPVAAAAYAESLGATRLPPQPGQPDSFVVFTDPSGHPFCLCRA
ncbi:MAG: VOC family protein [Actinomycetes bacterium]